MKIDSKKLTKIIRDALKSVEEPYCVSSGVAIGEINGAQIQLNISRDKDDRWPMRKANQCVATP